MQYGIPLVPVSKDYCILLCTSPAMPLQCSLQHICTDNWLDTLKSSGNCTHKTHKVCKIKVLTLKHNYVIHKLNFQHYYHFLLFWKIVIYHSPLEVVKLWGYLIYMESLFWSSHLFQSFRFHRVKAQGKDGKYSLSFLYSGGGMGPGVRCAGFKSQHPS